MATVFKSGQMAQSTKVIGKTIKLMDKVYFGMCMEINMKGGGSEIKPMVMENILIVMVPHMKVTGKMTCNMDKV